MSRDLRIMSIQTLVEADCLQRHLTCSALAQATESTAVVGASGRQPAAVVFASCSRETVVRGVSGLGDYTGVPADGDERLELGMQRRGPVVTSLTAPPAPPPGRQHTGGGAAGGAGNQHHPKNAQEARAV